MAFVHGHARDNGWVVAHVRAPVEAQEGQLPLVPDPVEPADPAGPVDREPDEAPPEVRAAEPLGAGEQPSTSRS